MLLKRNIFTEKIKKSEKLLKSKIVDPHNHQFLFPPTCLGFSKNLVNKAFISEKSLQLHDHCAVVNQLVIRSYLLYFRSITKASVSMSTSSERRKTSFLLSNDYYQMQFNTKVNTNFALFNFKVLQSFVS